MKPIYEPKGKAKEYGDLAINIYTGCPHRCYYCFAPGVLHKERELFHSHVEPRPGIVEATRKQLETEQITGKLVHLCFTCDPYPIGYDTSTTREIIKLLKGHGNHVQILTKSTGSRDFDLLDSGDWYGITLSCLSTARITEPFALDPYTRIGVMETAHGAGIKTWVSFEPVTDEAEVLDFLRNYPLKGIDKVKIGKLNYHKSSIDWRRFGEEAEKICQRRGIDYYIKDSLRAEMEGNHG